jgi:hypothetical protein
MLHYPQEKTTSDMCIQIFTGLPIINIEGREDVLFRVKTKVKDQFKEMTIRALMATVAGETTSLWLEAPLANQISVTYSLAKWVGDRIIKSPTGKDVQFFSKTKATLDIKYEEDLSRVWLDKLSIIGTPVIGQKIDLAVRINWSDMPLDEKRTYRVLMDELSSELNLEVRQYLGEHSWVYNPGEVPIMGEQIIKFQWNVTRHSSPYRSSLNRTILARIIGPGIESGNNWVRKSMEFKGQAY